MTAVMEDDRGSVCTDFNSVQQMISRYDYEKYHVNKILTKNFPIGGKGSGDGPCGNM